MQDREHRVARRALPFLAVAWVAHMTLLILLQTSVLPQLQFPAEHFIAREAYQSCSMLVLCAAFWLSSYTLLVTWRAARTRRGAVASARTPLAQAA